MDARRLLPARPALLAAMALAAAAGLATLTSVWAAHAIERRTAAAVKSRLLSEGIAWVQVTTDGLRVHLAGIAPNEAQRLRALNLAGSVVDAGRIRDGLDVVAFRPPEAPAFSLEMLRNDDGLSLIGLMPAPEGAEPRDLAGQAAAAVAGAPVSDMLETAAWAAPEGWDAAVDYALAALAMLPRSKISVTAERVAITAITDSEASQRRLESELARKAPPGLKVEVDISSPRPVLTPFTLRFVISAAGARFDACSADTDRARDRILAAGARAGVTGKQTCTVGLGVPTPRWAEAAERAIAAAAELGDATVTFSDADVTLLAGPSVAQAAFDRVAGELQSALPPVFSLNATLAPRPQAAAAGPAEFTAALSAGRVELRGRLSDPLLREAVDGLARARFGHDAVYMATRLDPDLPAGWPSRVLAGLDALAELDEGRLTVRADHVAVSGVTGREEARARIAQLLSERLGPGQDFSVDVRYDAARDPQAALPAPEVCVQRLAAVLAVQKITFAPGSAEIAASALPAVDALAEVLLACPPMALEIAGHTDSQGSAAGNRALSQARAESVLLALTARRVRTEAFVARGYGEDRPIAGNATEAGREANRRIEFALLRPAPAGDAATTQTPATASTDAPGPGAASDGGEAVPPADAPASPPAADVPLVVAAGPPDPVNGATRSITFSTADGGAEPGPEAGAVPLDPIFEPVAETYPRPPRRPPDP